MNNTILKKKITIQLKSGKSARHIIFEIELRQNKGNYRNYETLENIKDPLELSICGAYRLGGCSCQNLKTILGYADRVKAEDIKLFLSVCNIWELYHLNTLQVGTRKQEEEIKRRFSSYPGYDEACKYLEDQNLLIDRGYKYGSSWLVKALPVEIVNLIKAL